MIILEIKDMNKYYQNGEEKLHVLKNVNLKVEEGEFLVVLGASGSGKSTTKNSPSSAGRFTFFNTCNFSSPF